MPVWWLRPFTVGKAGSLLHANARLAPMGRLLIVQPIEGGMPQAHVAAQMGLSRSTLAKCWRRWVEHGEAGPQDRSSRPYRSPRCTDAKTEEQVCRLRRQKRWGPGRSQQQAPRATGIGGCPQRPHQPG